MSRTILSPHIHEDGLRRPLLFSLLGHALLFSFFLFGVGVFTQGDDLIIGSGPGGGQSSHWISVGLTEEPSGGTGMYKPSLLPRPEALSPSPPKAEPEAKSEPTQPDETAFVEPVSPGRKKPKQSPKATKVDAKKRSEAPSRPGLIPRKPEPGHGGPGTTSAGSGGGSGGGHGVSIGTGSGEGVIESWYARQVEQRIGQNWLKTSLGHIGQPVQTVIRFEIRPSGAIENVRLRKGSGIRSVDLAAERAVRASDPLPPLPYEFGGRRVSFVAYFEYPPG